MDYTRVIEFILSINLDIKLRINGDSMLPDLQNNEIVKIVKCDNYELGDVVLFVYENKYLLIHRIVSLNKDYYFCKGDNAFKIEQIPHKNVYGKCVCKIRNDKEIQLNKIDRKALELSYKIGILLKELNYDYEKVKVSDIYNEYNNYYLKRRGLDNGICT